MTRLIPVCNGLSIDRLTFSPPRFAAAVNDGEDAGHKEKCCHSREHQAPDDRSAQGRVLLAAFTQAQRHRETCRSPWPAQSSGRGELECNPLPARPARRARPTCIRSRANDTIRMELAVATPMHITAPVSDGTLSVVCVSSRIHAIPASAPGKSCDDNERIKPRLEVHYDHEINQQNRAQQPDSQADERGPHGFHLSADDSFACLAADGPCTAAELSGCPGPRLPDRVLACSRRRR